MQKYIENLKNKNIHIVGACGAEGSAVLEFLVKNGIKNITAHDFSSGKEELWRNFSKTHLGIKNKTERLREFEKILKLPARLNLKDKYLSGIMEADLIFVPSSWQLYKPNFPALQNAKDKSIEFSSITKLYFQLAKGKIISVTGTKGKGTTSRLIYDILCHPEAQGAEGSRVLAEKFVMPRDSSSRIFGTQNDSIRAVYLAGNDRRAGQELDKIYRMSKGDILVLETSNRQLMNDLGRSPNIGVITNISPDHIDEHGSFANYIEVKKSLFQYAGKDNIAVLNHDNEITKKFGEELIERGVKVFFFSRKSRIENGAYAANGKIYVKNEIGENLICDIRDIKIIGEHNIENILAAALVGILAGVRPEQIKKAVQEFHSLTHRIEFVGEYVGARFYDDLASTNPDSTIAAIESMPNAERQTLNARLILIAGGDDKGMDYAGLANEIVEKVDSLILLPGTGSEALKCQMTNVKCQINVKAQMSNKIPLNPPFQKGETEKLKIFKCNDFLEALEIIKTQAKAGDIVLISPACAHFQARYIDVLGKPLRNIIFCPFEPVSRQGEIA